MVKIVLNDRLVSIEYDTVCKQIIHSGFVDQYIVITEDAETESLEVERLTTKQLIKHYGMIKAVVEFVEKFNNNK